MKKFMLGLLVGLLLTTTVFAFASSEQIQALLTNFNFVVNGQVQTLETQPIAYNGTSYLPVRELANMLGYDVEYKADTRTIELSNTKEVNNVNNNTTAKQTMNGRELVNLLAEKYPEYINSISLTHKGALTINNRTYNLTLVSDELGYDITPLIKEGILD